MNIIHSDSIESLRTIYWYGNPVHSKYDQIIAYLKNKGANQLADTLAKPIVPEDVKESGKTVTWLSPINGNGTPIPKLSGKKQELHKKALSRWLEDLKQVQTSLASSNDPDLVLFSEIFPLIAEIPDLEHIYIVGERIVVTGWGFKSNDIEKRSFRLTKALGLNERLDENEQPRGENKNHKEESGAYADSTNDVKNDITNKSAFIKVALILVALIALGAFMYWHLFRDRLILPDNTLVGVVENAPTSTDNLGRKVLADRLLVTLGDGVNTEDLMRKIHDNKEGLEFRFIGYDRGLNILQMEIGNSSVDAVTTYLYTFSDVLAVSRDALYENQRESNDPALSQPISGANDYQSGWGLEKVNARDLGQHFRFLKNTHVAVIDSGFEASHPEISSRIYRTHNIATSPGSLNKAGKGHGLHVAATIAGIRNNGKGSFGVCQSCTLTLIDVSDKNGNISTSSIIKGLQTAIKIGAKVVNISLGSKIGIASDVVPAKENEVLGKLERSIATEAMMWDRLFGYALAKGVYVVQAAGNYNGPVRADPMKRSNHTIKVAASDVNDTRASFSTYGEAVDISAPGVQIYSATPNQGFGFMDGTSMAAPFVTGAVAMLTAANPNLSLPDIKKILVETGKKIPPDSQHRKVGPRLDIVASLRRVSAQDASCGCDNVSAKLQKIEEILASISDCRINSTQGTKSDSPLTLPTEETTDFSFAAGRWLASDNLIRTSDDTPIALIFDLNSDGTGALTLKESDGGICHADITLTMSKYKLEMSQIEGAKCKNNKSNKTSYYPKYTFECVSTAIDPTANCTASSENQNNVINFTLKPTT